MNLMQEAYVCAGVRTPVRRYGGAIAPGRPRGMSGARRALCGLSVGVGQGVAMVIEREA